MTNENPDQDPSEPQSDDQSDEGVRRGGDAEAPFDPLESTVDSISDVIKADAEEPDDRQIAPTKELFDNASTGLVRPFGLDINAPIRPKPNGLEETWDELAETHDSPGSLDETHDIESPLKTDDRDDVSIDDNEQTVNISDTEKTVVVAGSGSARSLSDSSGQEREDDGNANDTATDIDATMQIRPLDPEADTVISIAEAGGDEPSDSSARGLDHSDIGQTINPRELSDEDADFWGSLLVSGSGSSVRSDRGDATQLRPAIERSISETNLQIREREVVTPKQSAHAASDFRLIRLLGKGGMGNVFVARQASLDRLIAVKVIKPMADAKRKKLKKQGRLESVEQDRRHQFLSEAVVTGDLDHPNIVPIHDIAVTGDDTLFYAMKRVVGTPWSKVIHEKTRDENLDILLKVADAIGFAHTRAVVHRDIKPENIMLGDFGVVLVMDWGLALAKPEFEKIDSIAHTAGLGGTPAFMAPEMATGPIEKIGPASDVYLLGATLFLIVTGQAPHQAENITQCIKAVAVNEIRAVDDRHHGELLSIALKAMATEPEDRYRDVPSFQQALRDYRSHSESISLAAIADQDLQDGLEQASYNDFSRASYGYEQALGLWSGNEKARLGLEKARIMHAKAALEKEDFDLGLSLLSDDEPTHQALIEQLNDGIHERELRLSRLSLFKRLAAAMLLFILVGGGIALYFINNQRNQEIMAKKLAVKQTLLANKETKRANQKTEEVEREKEKVETQRKIAVEKTEEANRERDNAKAQEAEAKRQRAEADRLAKVARENAKRAEQQTQLANAQKEEADKQRDRADEEAKLARKETEKAEYEAYLSQIRLVKAAVERNEFEDARRILRKQKEERGASRLGWEWRWLWHQTHQATAVKRTEGSIVDLSLSVSSRAGIVALENGTVELLTLDDVGRVLDQTDKQLRMPGNVTAVAFSPNGQLIAVGTSEGDVSIWDSTLDRQLNRLVGHEESVTDLEFANNDRVISGSIDRTARMWSIRSGKELMTLWHIAPVRQLDVVFASGALTLATAVADGSSGRAVIWRIENGTERPKGRRIGEFSQHTRPISSIALSGNGDLAATGDVAGNVMLWRPASTSKTDYETSIETAIAAVSGKEAKRSRRRADRPAPPLIDPTISRSTMKLISTRTALSDSQRAHTDVVETLRFSQDGKRLLSGSDDYTVKIWSVGTRKLEQTLRGHGGWVTRATFVADGSRRVLSVSKDASIRSWDSDKYTDASVLIRQPGTVIAGTGQHSRLHDDEIWSARFDSTGRRVVSASRDHTARIMAVDRTTMTFREIAKLERIDQESDFSQLSEGTPFQAMSVAVDRVHGRLFVGSADSTVRIWDLVLGTEIGQLSGTGLNTTLALSRNGRLLLTGSSSPETRAILWGIDPTGERRPKQLYRLKGHDQAVTAFAISPSGRMLFTGDRAGIGWFWDTKTGRRIGRAVEDARGFRINAARFSPDGKELLIAADDQQLTRIDVVSRRRVARLGHEGFVTQLSISEDGRRALTVSELTTEKRFVANAQLWDLDSGKARSLDRVESRISNGNDVRRAPRIRITSAKFGGQNRMVVISRSAGDGQPGRIRVWDLARVAEGNSQPKTVDMPRRLGPAQVATPLTNEHMLTLNGDAAFLWNLNTMAHEKSYRAHAALTQASFSFDGKYVATASRSVKIWNAETGTSVGKLENPHRGPVRAVQFAKRGPEYILATAGDDGWARVWRWNSETRQFARMKQYALTVNIGGAPEGQRLPARCVGFSDDGRLLFAAGVGGIARVWSIESDSMPTAYDMKGIGEFTCGGFSRDGRWIVLGSDDKQARLWRVVDPNSKVETPIVLEGHADQIEDVVILQDASEEIRVLTASLDKSARVWDPRIGSDDKRARELIVLRKHTLGVTAVDATRDGELIMTAGRDGAVILWPAIASEPSESLFDVLNSE